MLKTAAQKSFNWMDKVNNSDQWAEVENNVFRVFQQEFI